jgi:ATP synthase protein I
VPPETPGRPAENATGYNKARIYSRIVTFGIVAAQLVTGAALAGGLLILADARLAYSVLVGTLIGAVPNFYLARRIVSLGGDVQPGRMLRAFYVGETIKILSSVAMFVIAMMLLDVHVMYVFGGYLATLLVFWFALLMPEPRPGS